MQITQNDARMFIFQLNPQQNLKYLRLRRCRLRKGSLHSTSIERFERGLKSYYYCSFLIGVDYTRVVGFNQGRNEM